LSKSPSVTSDSYEPLNLISSSYYFDTISYEAEIVVNSFTKIVENFFIMCSHVVWDLPTNTVTCGYMLGYN
jgi:hypothetical protein